MRIPLTERLARMEDYSVMQGKDLTQITIHREDYNEFCRLRGEGYPLAVMQLPLKVIGVSSDHLELVEQGLMTIRGELIQQEDVA